MRSMVLPAVKGQMRRKKQEGKSLAPAKAVELYPVQLFIAFATHIPAPPPFVHASTRSRTFH